MGDDNSAMNSTRDSHLQDEDPSKKLAGWPEGDESKLKDDCPLAETPLEQSLTKHFQKYNPEVLNGAEHA